MTEEPPVEREGEPADDDRRPIVNLPRWVSLLIGIVLLGIAALAVYTGLRQRNSTLEKLVMQRHRETTAAEEGGAPGEPEAGASRVLHGQSGEAIPVPGTVDPTKKARMTIEGTRAGIEPIIRMSARRGAVFHVQPQDAVVYINNEAIGPASQFGSNDDAYEFAAEGAFDVRITAPGFKDAHYVIVSDRNAQAEIAVVNAALQPGEVGK